MHWIENALANVNLEALNDVLRWMIGIFDIFELDIGTGKSLFETTIPLRSFSLPIYTLAFFIVVVATVVKLWITMASPFENAEEPGAIALRLVAAGAGVSASRRLFMFFEEGFNSVYKKFVASYKKATESYTDSIFGKLTKQLGGDSESKEALRIAQKNGSTRDSASDSSAFNLFSGESLINPDNTGYGSHAPLGILILELIIGFTLMISFFRLVLEVYERYVLIGVMYITAPLAFASIIGRDSKIFRSWMEMLVSQFILMCTNLIFIGGFIRAWYNIISRGLDSTPWLYDSYQQYLATNFALIGWLVIGQKLDQHLKGLGLSTAQTGAGLMGAMAGGALMARTALGVAGSALGTASGVATRTAMGNNAIQRAYKSGSGLPGMLPGAGNGKTPLGQLVGATKNDSTSSAGKSAEHAGSGEAPKPATPLGAMPVSTDGLSGNAKENALAHSDVVVQSMQKADVLPKNFNTDNYNVSEIATQDGTAFAFTDNAGEVATLYPSLDTAIASGAVPDSVAQMEAPDGTSFYAASTTPSPSQQKTPTTAQKRIMREHENN